MVDAFDIYPENSGRFDPLGVHPHTIPTPGIFDSPVVKVCINAEWASHLTGMMERLIYLDAWAGTESERYAAIDNIVKIISEFDNAENQGDCNPMVDYPVQYIHFHLNSIVLSGNGIAAIANASQEFGWLWRQNTAAINDETKFRCLLAAGNYTLRTMGSRSSAAGIVSLTLPAPNNGWTFDLYRSTTELNYAVDIPFTIETPGLQEFKFKVASKNASSSGYVFNCTYFSIK